MLIERNQDTTKWPKMDITNCRSMELFKNLGIDKDLRDFGRLPKLSNDQLGKGAYLTHQEFLKTTPLTFCSALVYRKTAICCASG